MATNLFKPEAQRRRDLKGIQDIIISFAIFLCFIAAVIYIGYRVGNSYQPTNIHSK